MLKKLWRGHFWKWWKKIQHGTVIVVALICTVEFRYLPLISYINLTLSLISLRVQSIIWYSSHMLWQLQSWYYVHICALNKPKCGITYEDNLTIKSVFFELDIHLYGKKMTSEKKRISKSLTVTWQCIPRLKNHISVHLAQLMCRILCLRTICWAWNLIILFWELMRNPMLERVVTLKIQSTLCK